jgi:hypothetical protein
MRYFFAHIAIFISCCAQAQEPVKHIGVFVDPYYRAAENAAGKPQVAVARAFDERLSANDPQKIKEVEAEVRAKPELNTPMTLMVLSIRLYDMGFRDEAVFWHYVAKDRMFTIAQVISGGIAGAITATRDFSATAGYTINGYAFCDFDKQKTLRRSALDWVRANPYQAIFLEQLPSNHTDRSAALRDAIEALEVSVKKEAELVSDPRSIERFQKARGENGAAKKYCW